MSKVGLGALAVVLNRANATAVRHTNYNRHGLKTFAAVLQLGQLSCDLVEGRKDKAIELNLGDRAVAAHGKTDSGADDAGLGNWRIEDALGSELSQKTFGNAEHTTELGDVFTKNQNLVVVFHCLRKTGG